MKFCDVNFSWYLVNVFFDAFLDYSKCPLTTGTVIVFNPHIFVISISRSLYLDNFSATFTDVFRSEGIACLFLLTFNNDVRFISFDRFIGVYLHIPENGNFFIFCNSFWLVLVPLIICFDVVML